MPGPALRTLQLLIVLAGADGAGRKATHIDQWLRDKMEEAIAYRHTGYCEKTEMHSEADADCDLGRKGVIGPLSKKSWNAGHNSALRDCLTMCSRCPRCRYVSFSSQWRELHPIQYACMPQLTPSFSNPALR